jgi:hypothetical protein
MTPSKQRPFIMTETKHTPGPWEIFSPDAGPDYHPGIEALEGSFSIVVYGDEDDVTGVQGRTRPEALANAHLIAAAPDLLEALEGALPSLERLATEEMRGNRAPTGQPPRTAALERYEIALAAISKARGEDQ